jgi:CDP-glucose 4,6-dehydratase
MTNSFWRGRRVLITGHTGFKGSWLSIWLSSMGAEVTGYALSPPLELDSMFTAARVATSVEHIVGDVRDLEALVALVRRVRPQVIFHLAAQSLVRRSYIDPIETYSTNIMGTTNVLEAVRQVGGVSAVVVVTSDKCYDNREWIWGYRETDALGGYDPYSSSKAGAEIVTAAYRSSFFNPADYPAHGVAIASARAGNVIGGGDWSEARLVPDAIACFKAGVPVTIRNPHAVRPWQHVLEPLSGYIELAERLAAAGPEWGQAWNFGPETTDTLPVEQVVEALAKLWGQQGAGWQLDQGKQPHEANLLKLDCSKAREKLGWKAKWSIKSALSETVSWYRAHASGEDMNAFTRAQIEKFTSGDL